MIRKPGFYRGGLCGDKNDRFGRALFPAETEPPDFPEHGPTREPLAELLSNFTAARALSPEALHDPDPRLTPHCAHRKPPVSPERKPISRQDLAQGRKAALKLGGVDKRDSVSA